MLWRSPLLTFHCSRDTSVSVRFMYQMKGENAPISNKLQAQANAKIPANRVYNPPSPIPFCIGVATCDMTQAQIPLNIELQDTAELEAP